MIIPCGKGTTTRGEKVGQSTHIRTSTTVKLANTKYSPEFRPVDCKRSQPWEFLRLVTAWNSWRGVGRPSPSSSQEPFVSLSMEEEEEGR